MTNKNMDTKPAEKVKSFVPTGQPYFIHRSWRKYMGRGATPANKHQPCWTRFEAVSVLFDEWVGDQSDIVRFARQFNWPEADVRTFLEELKSDGVFDLVHPERRG